MLGEISISGTILKVDELANSLQLCLDSGAKKVLLPISSAADLGSVPPELLVTKAVSIGDRTFFRNLNGLILTIKQIKK